ncbi:ead/Ea22-like family protein [Salmonella enterica]|nr:ead/Ea22-like family protein [Salmonella enterica]
MSKAKIYTASPSDLSPPVQSESFCVDLVLASDYQELEAKCVALAAENAALKKSEVEFNEYCRRECEDVGDTWVDDFTETPATDAFLAEIRAQGADELAELYFTLAAHEANRYIADSWRESARFAKDHAAQIRQEAAQ